MLPCFLHWMPWHPLYPYIPHSDLCFGGPHHLALNIPLEMDLWRTQKPFLISWKQSVVAFFSAWWDIYSPSPYYSLVSVPDCVLLCGTCPTLAGIYTHFEKYLTGITRLPRFMQECSTPPNKESCGFMQNSSLVAMFTGVRQSKSYLSPPLPESEWEKAVALWDVHIGYSV
jgi:hypothetical protein